MNKIAVSRDTTQSAMLQLTSRTPLQSRLVKARSSEGGAAGFANVIQPTSSRSGRPLDDAPTQQLQHLLDFAAGHKVDICSIKSAPWYVKLSLQLLYQHSQGSTAHLVPYLQQLPNGSDSPVIWDEAKLQLLQYPHLIQQVKEQRADWEELFKGLQAAQKPGKAVSRQDFYWAMSIVRSRTFSGPYVGSTLKDRGRVGALVLLLVGINTVAGLADIQTSLSAAVAALIFNVLYELILSRSLKQYAICPLIDLINHSSLAQAEVSYDFFSDSYIVAAGQDYSSGQQVFVSYGAQSNDSLMQFYGFSEVDNPHDVYVMTNLLKSLERCMAERPSRERLETLNKQATLVALQLVAVRRNGFPPATLQALRYLLASDVEASRGPQAFATSGSDEAEQRLAAVLVRACQDELLLMGTSLADDIAALTGKRARPASAAEQLPVHFRIEKKKVLTACLKALGGDLQ